MSSIEGPLDFNKPHSELTEEEQHLADQKIDQALTKAIKEMIL